MSDTICDVAWDTIRVSPFQPRRLFSEIELNELAASIRSVGMIHPPVVRKIESQGKFLYYELIAGERRWRAAKRAGLDTLSVIVRDTSDDQAAKTTLIENVQRVDLDPIEMADAFHNLITAFRMTQEEVSLQVGKKRSTVANYLRLLSLPQAIQEAVSKGEISMGHAKAILSVDKKDLQEMLHTLIVEKQLTVRQAEEESLKLAKRAKKRRLPKEVDPHLQELEEKLMHALGTKVTLHPTNKTAGRIEIHYYSLDDLDHLIHQLA